MRTLPIFLAFFVMGVADAMGPMTDAVKRNYQLSNVMATLLPVFVFIAFAIFSVPGGVLAARAGKKKVLLLGLGINAVAVLIPSLLMPSYGLLLGCIFLLGVGTTYLQVAGNPIMRDVSAEGAYARNLSFAQFIKGVGSSAASGLVGLVALLPLLGGMKWRGVFPVFFVLMALAFITVSTLKIEEAPAEAPPSVAGSLALLKEPVFAMAVLGIFLYVGAEVCMSSFLKPALSSFGFTEEHAYRYGPTLFFVSLTIGRLLGSGLLRVMTPRNAFRLSALLGALGAVVLMMGGRVGAFAGPLIAGLGFANIWPLLFSLTVEERPGRGAELSGLMCMAISGGAVVPLLMGRLADVGSLRFAFIVPLACFAYLLLLSAKGAQKAEA